MVRKEVQACQLGKNPRPYRGFIFFIMAELRNNEKLERIKVNQRYEMITSRLTHEDWKTIRTKEYWKQRDKFNADKDKKIFTIDWIRIWNQTGKVGNNVYVKPRPDNSKTALMPNSNFSKEDYTFKELAKNIIHEDWYQEWLERSNQKLK